VQAVSGVDSRGLGAAGVMKLRVDSEVCTNAAILDLWHPLAPSSEIQVGVVRELPLLGETVSCLSTAPDVYLAWRTDPATPVGTVCEPSPATEGLPILDRYGYLWTSLGVPNGDLFDIPEYDEPDRRNIHAATIGVHCSAPRAIENFLDMGHFPYVHTGVLGIEPHTEVVDYDVHIDAETNDLWATNCLFFQPVSGTTSTGGAMVGYTYRVPHPYCTLLYKTSPLDESRMDVIGLFVRSAGPDRIEAHMILSLLDDSSTESHIRRFQQAIFAEDKPILENQHPKLLPLDPRAETPVRSDRLAIAYRRWLSDLGVTYGVIPEE